MGKFSIVTVYWGSDEPLIKFINDCKKWTDDIVVVYIDLYNHSFKNKDAKIVGVDHRFLLENGYGETFNLGIAKAKYDWTYIMGVGKQIVKIDKTILDSLDSTTAAGFSSIYYGKKNGTKWVKFSNRKRSSILGKVHEEPFPIDDGYMSADVFASWKYLEKNTKDPLRLINEGYRALSRLRWYYLYNTGQLTEGPNSFKNSMSFLQDKWGSSGINKINKLYKKYEYLYSLNSKDLCLELSKIDKWKNYDL
jgi:hypothetical protein